MRRTVNWLTTNWKPDYRLWTTGGHDSYVGNRTQCEVKAMQEQGKKAGTKSPTYPARPSQWVWYFKLRDDANYGTLP